MNWFQEKYKNACGRGVRLAVGFLLATLFFAGGECIVAANAAESVSIDETNFPDEKFREYVLKEIDLDDDTMLSAEEIAATTEIALRNITITDLAGIEFFTALEKLDCYANRLDTLDVSKNTELLSLRCTANQLTSLDVSNNTKLKTLDCSNNQLTDLDVRNNTELETLWCSRNQLTSLDVSNNVKLTDLDCSTNQLWTIDVSKNTALTFLYCYENQLMWFDVSNNGNIYWIGSGDCKREMCFGGDINLSALSGLNGAKTSNWSGAEYDAESNCLTNISGDQITYTYNCGGGKTETFTIVRADSHVDNDENGQCDGCGVTATIAIDEANFPDAIFRAYVLTTIDVNENQLLEYSEIKATERIYVDDMQIKDLTGIEYFTGLVSLGCSGNLLTELDTSGNPKLGSLNCGLNKLKTLDVSNNKELWLLSCGGNELTALDISNNKNLTELACGNNFLTQLDLSNNGALTVLFIQNNQLTSLDISNCSIHELMLYENVLYLCVEDEIDVSLLPGFDPAKASNWTGATYDAASNKLINVMRRIPIEYSYNIGKGGKATFKIIPGHGDTDNNGTCDGCGKLMKIAIDEINFPDDVFREHVRGLDFNQDGILNHKECERMQELDIRRMGVRDLTGIEHFENLRTLWCNDNELTSLDVSGNPALIQLWCDLNFLTSLDVSGNLGLLDLRVALNQLTSLDVSNCSGLKYLWCYSNQLTELDVSDNVALVDLRCGSNRLRNLDVSNNTALSIFTCDLNFLTSLDISNNLELTSLGVTGNYLREIDISKHTELTKFNCGDNWLTSLDISNNPLLWRFQYSGNQLTSLDLSNNPLITSEVFYNFGCERIICTEGEIDLSTLEGFDPSRAGNWSGATYDAATNRLIGVVRKQSITYTYDCGNGLTGDFTITPDHVDLNDDGSCDGCGKTTKFAINETTFPDEIFRNYILTEKDENLDEVLSWFEIWDTEQIYVPQMGIKDLKGIEFFEKTKSLVCFQNELRTLDLSNNTELDDLWCGENQLVCLDLSNNPQVHRSADIGNDARVVCTDGSTINLSQFPGFDAAKITNLRGAVYDAEGNRLTQVEIGKNITYLYECSDDLDAVFKIIPVEHVAEACPHCDAGESNLPEINTSLNGVALGSDGLWAYYVNGVIDSTFTGLAANESGTWYIENGYLNWDFTDLFSWTDGWYYVMSGRVPTEYTGLVRNSEGLWYVENAMINWNYTDLVSSAEGWFYVMDGRVTEEYTGLVRNEAGLWYVAGGKLDESHTDLVSSMDGWFYVMNGRVTEEYTGLVRNEAGLWYIANGKLDDTYTNLVSSVEGWFYAMNGRVTEEYTGLVANENGNWYVDKGAVSLTHEGLICDATGWWYVVQSHVAEDYTGLATNDAGTWYVQNGYLDFGFSGEVTVGEESYTVVGGMVQ